MSLGSQILARRMRLIAPLTLDIVCERDLRAPMDDGAVLLADRWVARAAADRPQPTVLVRSPYGRRQVVGLLLGRLLAERGLQVVIQSVRGTFGSEGTFAPFDERADGLATLRWIRAQPWHSDRIGMFGPSYLGFVQWAVAPEAGDDLAALAISVSASQFYEQTYAGGSLSLENVASWMVLVSAQEGRFALLAINRALRQLRTLMTELPLGDLDERATGAEVAWFREAFENPAREDPYWRARDFSARVAECGRRSSSSAAGTTSCCPGCSMTSPPCGGGTPSAAADRTLDAHRSRRWSARVTARGSPGCARTCWTTTGCCGTARCACGHRRALRRGVAGPRSWPPPGTSERRLVARVGRGA